MREKRESPGLEPLLSHKVGTGSSLRVCLTFDRSLTREKQPNDGKNQGQYAWTVSEVSKGPPWD